MLDNSYEHTYLKKALCFVLVLPHRRNISEVGGLLPEATNENKGLMSTYKSQHTNTILRYNDSTLRYVKIASINDLDNEGYLCHLSALIIGGNNYVLQVAVSIISICVHKGSVSKSRNNLIGGQAVGYVINSDSIDIYVECANYNHYLRIVPLSFGNITTLLNEVVLSKPSGWIDI